MSFENAKQRHANGKELAVLEEQKLACLTKKGRGEFREEGRG